MIWSGKAVPAAGLWAVLALGAILGGVAVLSLRRARPRTIGAAILGLAVLIPISARAITLITFTNGTVADANQVNANFAALTPIDGTYAAVPVDNIGSSTTQVSPSFVTPRSMTCTVYAESYLGPVGSTSPGNSALMEAVLVVNGTLTKSTPPPRSEEVATGYNSGVGLWHSAQTRLFTVPAGATVSAGCYTLVNGGFLGSNQLSCTVVYNCH
jgi:hypothetical protein